MVGGKTSIFSEMCHCGLEIEQDLRKHWQHYGFNSAEECNNYIWYVNCESCGYTVIPAFDKFMADGFGVETTQELLKKYPIEGFREFRRQRQ